MYGNYSELKLWNTAIGRTEGHTSQGSKDMFTPHLWVNSGCWRHVQNDLRESEMNIS